MKRFLRRIPDWVILLLMIAFVLFISYEAAKAEQVFEVVVIPEETPPPVYKEAEKLPYYRLDKKDVEVLAKLLWSSPLRDQSSKAKLLWLVFNRVDAGHPFGESIGEVVNVREFTFYDRKARVSDKNKEIVETEMTRWMAYKDGYGIGWHPSRKALYCRFAGENNRRIELLDDPYGKELKW